MRPVQEGTVLGSASVPRAEPDRPSLLLERPEPIAVIAVTPEGPPSWFRWRGLEQRVTASAGPQRIAEEWWGRGGAGRPPRRRSRKFGESYARAYERFLLGLGDCPLGDCPSPLLDSGTGQERDSPHFRGRKWGQSPGETRDYFKVQDEQGRWLWIYRALEQGGWYVHGLWA